jgi:ribosome biogenesis GTPase
MKTKNFSIHEGIITKKNNGQYWIFSDGKEYRSTAKLTSNASRDRNHRSHNPRSEERPEIVVGDHVHFSLNSPDSAQIQDILPRVNCLTRRAARPMPDSHPTEQIIAANIDQIVAVMSLRQPAPRWNLLDRYLVSAESLEIRPLICLTKSDLARDPEGNLDDDVIQEIDTYKRIGYHVLVTSTITGENIDELKHALTSRKSVLLGKSGAGKSSLANTLIPGVHLSVNTVNQVTGKGRHTTTGVEMHFGDFNGWLVDTPGTREFGLWGLDDEDLAWFFPEIRQYLGKCRFGLDCRHDEEPGCAVRLAVMAGEIHPRRYFSMMKLKAEGYFQW